MEFLNLEHTFKNMLVILIIMSTALAFTISYLIIKRIVKNIRWKKQGEHLNSIEKEILEILFNNGSIENFQFKPNRRTQNLLVELALKIRGEEKSKLRYLYQKSGFLRQDILNLSRSNPINYAKSLARCRIFEFPLPDEVWTMLLKHKSIKFRWAAMEYLVTTKGEKSLIWIADFISKPYNRYNGIILHILSSLAIKSQDTLFVLLKHTDEEWLTEQTLRVIAAYPQPGAEEFIINLLKTRENEELTIAGTKALAACPSPIVIEFFTSLVTHPHWVIRLEISKSIKNYGGSSSIPILQNLLLDSNYLVRRISIQALLSHENTFSDLIDEIIFDQCHPCHKMLVSEVKYGDVA